MAYNKLLIAHMMASVLGAQYTWYITCYYMYMSQYMLHIYLTLEIIKNKRGGLKLANECYMYT